MQERRGRKPSTTLGYLQQLPATVLLDRLLAAVVAVDREGEVAYANPAFARLLGYEDADAVTGRQITTLLIGGDYESGQQCVSEWSAADGAFVEWCHSEGFAVLTRASDSMLLRADDPLTLISVTDLTEGLWTSRRNS